VALPGFVGVGAEKAGTTPLALVLAQHRDVFLPPGKETHFFSRSYSARGLLWYETGNFHGHGAQRAVGEITPEYMRFPEVPGRLREALGPELKIIVCLREPAARAFSHYLQCVRLLQENESFARALELEEARIAEDRYAGIRRAYLGGSLYAAQVRRLLEHFPRQNIFYMVLEEDFVRDRAATVARLFEFLGVGPDPAVRLEVRDTSLPPPQLRFVGAQERVRYRAGRTRLRLPPGAICFVTGNELADRFIARPSAATRAYFERLRAEMTRELPAELAARLYERHFRDDIGRLEELIGRDLTAWRR